MVNNEFGKSNPGYYQVFLFLFFVRSTADDKWELNVSNVAEAVSNCWLRAENLNKWSNWVESVSEQTGRKM